MEKRNNPAGEPCRDWKETFTDVLMLITLVLFGILIGICLCKLCPPFWNWLNGEWVKAQWIPKVMFTVGAACISVGLCIKGDTDD